MTILQKLYDSYWEELLTAFGKTGRGNNQFFTTFFIDLCKQLDTKLVLEIGAHGADFSRKIVKNLPEITVIACEANPHVHAKYASKMPKQVDYRNCLVSTDNRSRAFYIPRKITTQNDPISLSQANPISSIKKRIGEVEYEEIICEAITVDKISQESDWISPCTLWIDVEGAVGEILFGAHQSLARNITLLFIEVETRKAWEDQWTLDDIRKFLTCKNFTPLCRDLETDWQFNEIYIRDDIFNNKIMDMLRTYISSLFPSAS